jgi:autotransporter translocation and assembly factor TamB
MREFDDAPPARESPSVSPTKRKKRWGCLWIVAGATFLSLLIGLLIFNGPGFRALARFGGLKAAESQGLKGDFVVSGTLASGFAIKNVNLSDGEAEGTSIRVEEIVLDYRGLGLVTGTMNFDWLETVRIGKAEIRLKLPAPAEKPDKPTKEEKPEKAPAETPGDFSPFWNLLRADFEIADLTLLIQQGDRVTSVESLQLRLPRDADGSLKLARLSLPGQKPLEDVDATIAKEAHGVTLGPLSLLGYAELESLAAKETSPGTFEVLAGLAAAGGALDLTVQARTTGPLEATLGLRRGTSLSLEQVPLPDSKLRGSVTDLSLRFAGDPAKPSGWDLSGQLIASKTGWDQSGVDSLLLVIKDRQLTLETARGRATVKVDASFPLDQAATIADLAGIPVRANLAAEVPSLAETTADFGLKLPLTGSLSLEAREIALARGRLASGSVLLESKDLAWDGIALSGAQIAAQIERENFVRLAADLGLDENTRVHLAASTDLTAKTYEGEAAIALDTKGRLGTVLADLDKALFTGAISLDWKGRGGFAATGHQGEATVSLRAVTLKSGHPIDGSIAATYSDKSARLESLSLKSEGVALTGSGAWDGKTVTLPNWKITHENRTPLTLAVQLPMEPGVEGGFLAQEAPLSIDLRLDQLAMDEVTRFFTAAPPIAGKLNGEVKAAGSFASIDLGSRIEFRPDRKPSPPVKATEAVVDAPAIPAPLATLDLSLKGDVDRPSSWDTKLAALLSGLSWNGMALENISLDADTDTTRAERPLVARVKFDQSSTLLDATARLDLAAAETFADLAAAAVRVDASLGIGSVATLLADFAPPNLKALPLAGSLSATVEGLKLERGSLTAGTIALNSPDFAVENQAFETIRLDASIPANDEIEASLILALDDKTRVEGKGGFHLKKKEYSGALGLNADLVAKGSKLRALLGGRKMADLLPGTTALEWQGDGRLADGEHAGTLNLKAKSLRLAAGAEPLDAEIAGTYSADAADFPTLKVKSQPLSFAGALTWKEKQLGLTGKGTSGGREAISLAASLPLDPEKLKPELWFGQESPLSLDLRIQQLSIGTVSKLFLAKAPVLGEINLGVIASGSPAAPQLDLDLALGGLTVPREGQAMPVGQLELKADARDDRLTLSGEYRHPEVKPLTLSAALPFFPGAWATGKRKVADETLSASAKMERSSLAFLVGQVPGIESIAGEIALDATVSGTVAAPQIRGNSSINLTRLRLENRNAPSLHDVEVVATFGENRIVLERLNATVAGGSVTGNGEALLKPGGEPTIRFSLKGSEVLVVRTPDLNVRTDLDITLAGPWSKASLSGEIGITNSRFFKNFDLLPIGLPAKKTQSALPTVERTPRGGGAAYQDLNVGVPIAPFKDWPVALRIHTKDPFLIRSNLLESSITADLRLVGTLGRPTPVGAVDIAKGEMSLPFSKINVETGRVVFDEATGFNGALEFKARGKADRYQIAIYLYDRVLSPQYVLTSIPPMPSEDIITLLATGTTRNELTGDDAGSVAAGKAAGLLLKNLQKKSNEAEGDPTLLDLLEDRTELVLGRVNQETGEQTFGGKIRLWRQLFFVGDVDQQSDYRALLKYVFQFE